MSDIPIIIGSIGLFLGGMVVAILVLMLADSWLDHRIVGNVCKMLERDPFGWVPDKEINRHYLVYGQAITIEWSQHSETYWINQQHITGLPRKRLKRALLKQGILAGQYSRNGEPLEE